MRGGVKHHKIACSCYICKSKRGETKGKNSYNYGRIPSEEVKEKYRLAHLKHKDRCKCICCKAKRGGSKGKKNGAYGKPRPDLAERNRSNPLIGAKNGMYGKRHKESTILKLKSYTGDKTSNWQGGKSFEDYTKLWNSQLKEVIRVRDWFKCRLCGIQELALDKRLAIHHIDYNKKNCRKSNLISLCNSCHSKTSAGNRKYWIKHLKEVLNGKMVQYGRL